MSQAGICPGKIQSAYVPTGGKDVVAGFAGRPSELEAQIGVVVRLGREAAIPTPTHTFLYSSLLPLEARARGQIAFAI